MRSQGTLIRFEGQAPKVRQRGSIYRSFTREPLTLFLKGDIWAIKGQTFSSPDDSLILSSLFNLYSAVPHDTWQKVQGDFTAVVIGPDFIEAYRSPFSPHLLFWHKRTITDQLIELSKEPDFGFEFSTDYLKDFVLDVPSLQFGLSETPLKHVQRLTPHTRLFLQGDSQPLIEQYDFEPYHLCNSQVSLNTSALELRDKLRQVLSWHLAKQGSLAAELSGGLDSSFVASLLSDLRPNSLEAHMFSFRRNPSHLFSEECAQHVAKEKGIKLNIVDSDLAEVNDLSNSNIYQNEPVDFYWQGALFGNLSRSFLKPNTLLFTGFGCDQLFMRNAAILNIVAQEQGFFSGLELVKEIAHSLNRSSLNFSYQYLLNQLPQTIKEALVDMSRTWKINPFKIDELVPEASRWERISWIKKHNQPVTGSYLQQARQRGQEIQSRFFHPLMPQPNLNYLIAPQYVLGPYLEPNGITYIHPFCDSRIIDFAFKKVRFSFIHDFKSPYKQFLRESMRGIVPEKVRTRPQDEFSFDGYYYRFLKKNEAFLRNLVEEALPENEDWIEPQLFRKAFESMLFGGYTQSEVAISRFLSYLVWKRLFCYYMDLK